MLEYRLGKDGHKFFTYSDTHQSGYVYRLPDGRFDMGFYFFQGSRNIGFRINSDNYPDIAFLPVSTALKDEQFKLFLENYTQLMQIFPDYLNL